MNQRLFECNPKFRDEIDRISRALSKKEKELVNLTSPAPTNRIKLVPNTPLGYNRDVIVMFPGNTGASYVFENLRTNIPDKYIENIEFDVGGQRVDKIEGKMFKYLRVIYNITDEMIVPFYCLSRLQIPSLTYHTIKLVVRFTPDTDGEEWSDDYGFWIDELSSSLPIERDSELSYNQQELQETNFGYGYPVSRVFYNIQTLGKTDLTRSVETIGLYFNDRVSGLILDGMNCDEFHLELDNEKLVFPKDQIVHLDPEVVYLPLYGGLDFSKIQCVNLVMSGNLSKSIQPYAVTGGKLNFLNGMCAVFFNNRY